MWGLAFQILRNTLEILYFCSGIVFVFVAVKGLQQIKVSKQIASASARREAYKLASEQCQMFADRVVPALNKLAEDVKAAKVNIFSDKTQFTVTNGRIENHRFQQAIVIQGLVPGLISTLNLIEAFAIPFAANLADDEIGFRETAFSFCANIRRSIPAIWLLRELKKGQYKSAVDLYERWNNRLLLEDLQVKKQEIEKGMASVTVQRASTIGTETD